MRQNRNEARLPQIRELNIQFWESSVDYRIQVIINFRALQIVTPKPGKRISVIRYRRISLGIFMWPFNGFNCTESPPRQFKQYIRVFIYHCALRVSHTCVHTYELHAIFILILYNLNLRTVPPSLLVSFF